MSVEHEELLRWRERASDPAALHARAADLVEAARDAPSISPRALARIQAEVLAQTPSHARRRLPIGLRIALLSLVVLASAATARGTMILWRRHIDASAAGAISRASSGGRARPLPRLAPSAPALSAPPSVPPASAPPVVSPPPPPVEASVIRPRRLSMASPTRPRVAASSAPSSTEAQLLASALSVLRQSHDPVGALSRLDQYAHAFPHGVLRAEALSTRIEAVIQMNDRKTALALLDGQGRFTGRLGTQLLISRAELRASAGRYLDAIGDFDRFLATTDAAAPVDVERALYGRAVCLGHLGHEARARADLVAYQRRFPHGKYAVEVARLLGDVESARRP